MAQKKTSLPPINVNQETIITDVDAEGIRQVFAEQKKLIDFAENINQTISDVMHRREYVLKGRYYSIFQQLEDAKRALEVYKLTMENLERKLSQSPILRRLTGELDFYKSYWVILEKEFNEITTKIRAEKAIISKNRVIMNDKKAILREKNSENLKLAAEIHKLRKVVNNQNIEPSFQEATEGEILPIDQVMSSIDGTNKLADEILKSPQSKHSYEHDQSKINILDPSIEDSGILSSAQNHRNVAEMSNTLHEHDTMEESKQFRTIDTYEEKSSQNVVKGQYQLSSRLMGNSNNNSSRKKNPNRLSLDATPKYASPKPLNYSQSSTHMQIPRMVSMNEFDEVYRRVRSLIVKNLDLKKHVIMKISNFNASFDLIQDGFRIQEQSLVRSQRVGNMKGLNGSLIFLLMQSKQKAMANQAPTTIKEIKHFEKRGQSYLMSPKIRNMEDQIVDVMNRAFKKMVSDEDSKQDRVIKMLHDIKFEQLKEFNSMQVMGLVMLKPQIVRDIMYEFEFKSRNVTDLANKLKKVKLTKPGQV